jgi:hypothetical protein
VSDKVKRYDDLDRTKAASIRNLSSQELGEAIISVCGSDEQLESKIAALLWWERPSSTRDSSDCLYVMYKRLRLDHNISSKKIFDALVSVGAPKTMARVKMSTNN